MSTPPPAIIFINADIDGYTKATLMSQLYINEFMTMAEFDARQVADPNYADIVHLQKIRIMVSYEVFANTNQVLADIVLFYSHGMVKVEKSNVGPPGLTLDISRVNIYTLLRDVGSKYVVILPTTATKPPTSLKGIVGIQGADSSGVHDPNIDSGKNNEAFINRK